MRRLLLQGFLFAFGLPAYAHVGTDKGVAECLQVPDDQAFEACFGRLPETEQDEAVRVLTTDLKSWRAVERLPIYDEGAGAKAKVLAWLHEPVVASDGWGHLKYVGLLSKPYAIKLKFEKSPCLREEPERKWTPRLAAAARAWRDRLFPAVLRTRPKGAEPRGACRRELLVSLASDQGGPFGLSEEPLVRADLASSDRFLEGAQRAVLRRRAWEALEILLSDPESDGTTLPQRLKVIEIVGELRHEEFLKRRKQAILLRARQHGLVGSRETGPGILHQAALNSSR